MKTLTEEARRDAAEADRKVATGQALGPLHGVPFTIKENIDFAGSPTTWGVLAFAGAIPPVDAPVVERMRAAGAIAIGRTNLPDMGQRMNTDYAAKIRFPNGGRNRASTQQRRRGRRAALARPPIVLP